MQIHTFYQLSLVLHIIGLTMMAGTTLIDYVVIRRFWVQLAIEKQRGLVLLGLLSRLPVVLGIGFLLLVLSGVSMMGITHGVFGEQLWFRVKFALITCIIINGIALGRRLGVQLRKVLATELSPLEEAEKLSRIRKGLRLFHFLQLSFFLVIFVLSVFKFN